MFTESWNSLTTHANPQWLRDAKFGIYTHWGIYSVHARGPNTTWYAHHLYKGHPPEVKYHTEHFGPLEKFGYTDFIPLFTAEKFDPDEWAEIFHDAGAKFAGPVAEHHDGFSMWRTSLNTLNSYEMGPKRDVVAELAKSYRAKDMKYMVALHHAENYWYFQNVPNTDSMNPQYEEMFNKEKIWPKKKFYDIWLAKNVELIDRFSPDMMWFDFGLAAVPDAYKRKFLSYYYNRALEANKEVAINYKNRDMIVGSGVIDLELGRFMDIMYHEWITDSTVDDGQAWGYMHNATYKSAGDLIHYLVDNVSKNGYLLLNVGPRADGTIPEEAMKTLAGIGKWLRLNGEAIYQTTPWYAAQEGPTLMKTEGMFSESEKLTYTHEDIRYTAKDNVVYATILARPSREAVLKNVARHLVEGEIESIRLLGFDKNLAYRVDGNEIRISMPDTIPGEHAYVLKIARKPAFGAL